MADMLATKEELASFMQDNNMDAATATLLLELATGEVQAAAGQRLVAATETLTLLGDTDSWLNLPQRPVTAVTSVTIDSGTPLVLGTDYKRFGARLWRLCGWASSPYEPSEVAVGHSHGWAVGAQALQPARSATLGLAQQGYSNPSGLKSEAIDDYRMAWAEAMSAAMASAPHLRASLRRTYGARAGLVRIG